MGRLGVPLEGSERGERGFLRGALEGALEGIGEGINGGGTTEAPQICVALVIGEYDYDTGVPQPRTLSRREGPAKAHPWFERAICLRFS